MELPPAKVRKVSANNCTSGSIVRGTPSRSSSIPGGSNRFSLPYVFAGTHGRHLQPYVICHSAEVQPEFDKLKIARGVQWELVRGIKSGSWTWEDVKAKLGKLKGANADVGPEVRSIMLDEPSRKPTPHELQELDREAKATVENKSRGFGLLGEFENVPDWYGGNIQLTIRLLHTGEDTEPEIRLEPLQMTRSHHLARELGSISVIALRDNKDGTLVKKWAARKFVFCGRVYIALPPKGSNVYLIETDEDHGRIPQEWCGDQNRISYDEYIRRNNPLDLNRNQPFAKYLTRLSLYLSTSVPALEFDGNNIIFIDDEYADGWCKEKKPPTEMIMTDGCGFLNRAAALKISARLKYERVPVAYQGRIAGSKGLWIIHPDNDSPEPRIWIRDSQKKIQLRRLLRAHRIFDLLAVSGPSSSLNLSSQSIVILANNGVPVEVFCSLQEEGLKALIKPLMDWNRLHATAYLWDAINNIGNVTRCRLQRLAAGASRALGFEKRAFDDADNGQESDIDPDLRVLPNTGKNVFSGEPLSVHESAMDLLQAGFHPRESPRLSFKIHYIIKSTMELFLTKYRIPLVNSLEAYMIPADPSGQLKEGEVFFKSSIDSDGPLREQVVRPRYPMRESSDMQKVTAVDLPALAQYVDVLIISVHGSRSLASLLAGGDDAIIIRDPAIVTPFQNKAVVPPPAEFLTKNFHRQVQSVTDFGEALEQMTIANAQCAFQKEVLIGLADNHNVGLYSVYHDCAVYKFGLDHEDTRRLAHMTATVLDASKTGLRLLEKIGEADKLAYGAGRARCFDPVKGHRKKRPSKLGPFVLDRLLAVGEVVKDELMIEFDGVASHIGDTTKLADPDTEELYKHWVAIAHGDTFLALTIAAELEVLKTHVDDLHKEYKRQVGKSKSNNEWGEPRNRKKWSKQTDNPMLPIMRDFRKPLADIPVLGSVANVDEIMASYAATRAYNFGFSMAFGELCELKRRAEKARGPGNRVDVLDSLRNMGAPARRLLNQG
ncbi:RNA dependent RNA polymerase-domain-containing protein [Mycena epipterygia]|nr:RNA dependent RNA polymerase-domain-containing protein [Mycena epipterygia]